MIYRTRLVAFAVAALMSGACTGPAYKTEHYTLVADQNAQQRIAESYSASLGVGPIRLPESLDQRGIISRGEGQRLAVAPYAIWAGGFNESITRVLADDLSSYLGTDRVWPFPWDNRLRPEHQVTIVVERFGGELGGQVELQAKWRLLTGNGDQLLRSNKFTAQVKAEDDSYDRYVAALNQLLHQLAEDIALAVGEE